MIDGDLLFNIMIFMMLAFLATTPPILLALHFLMPGDFLGKYFKPPFFQTWEVHSFSIFPSSFMRTVMVTAIIAFPSLGKKRKMDQAHTEVPPWYRLFAKAYWVYFFSLGAGFLCLLIGLFIYTATATP